METRPGVTSPSHGIGGGQLLKFTDPVIPSSRQADWRGLEARDAMLLPMNFRETAIALQSNPNIRACVSIVEEELHTALTASGAWEPEKGHQRINSAAFSV
uniref:Uncharacterized protein n=1 Tax=Candidatus Kentrum sp. DK TaxID=2126562 RepID=A0A450S051_9GAMM|nr:MAG: hypothetical protein BECKDK2373C_GA0170839_10102 [Candidatus Kentron sp. DK]